jgi:AraC family transcriptional regulator, regulatory protein of adaptative response / methylphosphotriester-DNA alkyltransferase methyltransferase
MALTDNEKWQAVLQCDATYDGEFFYGVKTTGVFCRPSCKSKTPLRNNVAFFDGIEKAYADGLRPCKRCRPDLLEYKPIIELLEQVKDIYHTYFDDNAKLSLAIKQLNISQNHLIRLFKQQFNMTPVEYINKLRIEKSVEYLASTDMNILNITLLCGFGSISNFYGCFKKQFGLTPNEYRKQKI